MLNGIGSWASGIVIAVVVSTIIEMILPEGNNKKYVKTVIGVFILFTIVAPIITKVSGNSISIETLASSFNIEQQNTNKINDINFDKNVEELYIENLKKDITNKIKEKGYNVKKVDIMVDMEEGEQYGKIKNIFATIGRKYEKDSEVLAINEISINVKDNTQNLNETNQETEDIKEYIAKNYEIDKKNIEINF